MQQGRAVKGTVVATLLALMVAACGGSAAPDVAGSQAATQPPVTPNAPTVTPTPVDTPTPTSSPEPAPTPTSAPSLLPISSVFEPPVAPKPNATKVAKTLKGALGSTPGSTDDLYTEAEYLGAWGECHNLSIEGKGREATCELLLGRLYYVYTQTGEQAFYDLAKAVYAQASATLSDYQVKVLRENLLSGGWNYP